MSFGALTMGPSHLSTSNQNVYKVIRDVVTMQPKWFFLYILLRRDGLTRGQENMPFFN